jgi:hypothetical protein
MRLTGPRRWAKISPMATTSPDSPDAPGRSTATLEDRAMDDIRFIRETMECANSFTAVPGRGLVMVGILALVAAGVAQANFLESTRIWMYSWVGAAVTAFAVGLFMMAGKARQAGGRFLSIAGRRFVLGLLPALGAAGILTIELYKDGRMESIAGTWLLLYGSAVVSAGAFSVRIVPIMGACFMVLGIGALFLPYSWANAVMAMGFGLVHLIFGIVIARRHGG